MKFQFNFPNSFTLLLSSFLLFLFFIIDFVDCGGCENSLGLFRGCLRFCCDLIDKFVNKSHCSHKREPFKRVRHECDEPTERPLA
jgi:hypothetical protein